MKIEFSHSADDLVGAADALDAGWRERKKLLPQTDPQLTIRRAAGTSLLIMGWGLAMILGSALLLTFAQGLAWIAVIILLLYFLFIVARGLSPAGKRRAIRRNFAENVHNADPTTVGIDDAGFHYMTETWHCHIQWKSIRQFYSTTAFFLFTDDTPMTCVIPKRAFADAKSQEEFERLVREQLTRAGVAVY